jgi:hypothetical protein
VVRILPPHREKEGDEMDTVVVYESMFGNTRAIGDAIAEGLRSAGDVRVGTVDEIPPEAVGGVQLVVVGGPTQSRRMAKPNARETAAGNRALKRFGPIEPGRESLRGWLDRLPKGDGAVAAFDTRFDKPTFLTGSAAREIAGDLTRKGYTLIKSESFFVKTTGGPLLEGELERAVTWGRELVAGVMPNRLRTQR